MAASGPDQERLAALPDGVVLVPTPDDPESAGTWTLVVRDVLSVVLDEDDAGLIQPVFTSADRLAAWRPEGGCYVERPARWVFEVTAADPTGRVAVDRGSADELVLAPAEVAALAAGWVPGADGSTGEPGAGSSEVQVLVATPAEPLPDAVMAALREVLGGEPAVGSARLFLIDVGADRNLVVFVDLVPTDGEVDVDAVMTRIVTTVADHTSDAGGLRFQVVTPEWRETYDTGGIPIAP